MDPDTQPAASSGGVHRYIGLIFSSISKLYDYLAAGAEGNDTLDMDIESSDEEGLDDPADHIEQDTCQHRRALRDAEGSGHLYKYE